MTKTCASCKHCEIETRALYCRVNPPMYIHGEIGAWPVVLAHHWCSHWVSNKPVARKTQERGKRLDEFLVNHDEYPGDHIGIGAYMPDEFLNLAIDEGLYEGWSTWADFVNYFSSADAKNPVKKDWLAAWRNWIRRSKK